MLFWFITEAHLSQIQRNLTVAIYQPRLAYLMKQSQINLWQIRASLATKLKEVGRHMSRKMLETRVEKGQAFLWYCDTSTYERTTG